MLTYPDICVRKITLTGSSNMKSTISLHVLSEGIAHQVPTQPTITVVHYGSGPNIRHVIELD
jgi:hypothetical protein